MPEQLIDQKPTAKASYRQSVESGAIETNCEIVMDCITKHEPCTNNDIMRLTGLDYKIVSNARWMLIKQKKIYILSYKKLDHITNRKNEQVAVKKNPEMIFTKKSPAEKINAIRKYLDGKLTYVLKDEIIKIINS